MISHSSDIKNEIQLFVPRVLEEINVILPILSSHIYSPDVISQKKQSLREKYIKQREKNPKAERNWFHQLKLMFTRKELIKDLIKIVEAFDLTLKDLVIDTYIKTSSTSRHRHEELLRHLCKDIEALSAYTQDQLRKNEKRYDLKNQTTIDINQGISCHLVNW